MKIPNTEKNEIEARAERKSFYEEYKEAREKARSQGYASLTKWEQQVLEKGDDYLLG